MKRILCSLLSILFVFGIWFSVPMTASAANNGIIYLGTYEIEEQINPIYKGVVDESDGIKTNAKVYYSDSLEDFDASIYSGNKEDSASLIRDGMENRAAKVTTYYKTTTELSEVQLNDLFAELQELAFAETDKATQGDSLRLGYKSSSASIQCVSDGATYYYEYTINYEYYTTKAQEQQLTTAVNNVLNSFGFTSATTDREKSDIIYRYITENVVYDNKNLNNEAYYLKFTPYAALINKTAVCQGYALLYYRLAEEAGLDSRVITGTSLGENHAWNIVKIDGQYYYADSTWDAGRIRFSYYLKGTSDFDDHTNEPQFEEAAFKNKYNIASVGYAMANFTGTEGYFSYTVIDDVAYITKYNGNEANVVVPNSIAGYPVYYVDTYTFFQNSTMKTLTFSEGIKKMFSESVAFCSALETINVPSTMNWDCFRFSTDVFMVDPSSYVPYNCEKVKTVNVAKNNPYMTVVDGVVYTADMEILLYCPPQYAKSMLNVPANVKQIANSAVEGCNNIKEVILPDDIIYIGYWAFSICENLEKCNIPKACLYIGQYAFNGCKLKRVDIPSTLINIVPPAFSRCPIETVTVEEGSEKFYLQNGALCSGTRLMLVPIKNGTKTFNVPNNITIIENQAFSYSQYENIILNSGLKEIRWGAFLGSGNLAHITIPDGVELIGKAVFFYCDNLMSVIIPDSVTEVEEFAEEYIPRTYYCSENTPAYNYLTSEGCTVKPLSAFKCSSGHKITKVYDDYGYTKTCSVCGDKGLYVGKISLYTAEVELVSTTINVLKGEKPQIKSIKVNGVELVEGVDYVVEPPCMGLGYQYLNIKGINDYTQECSALYFVLEGTLKTPEVYSTVNSAKGIKLTWYSVDGAEKYIVYQRVYNEKTKKYSGWKAVKTTTDLTYTDTTVKLGTIYSYTVKAVTGSVQSKFTATKGLRYNVTPTVKTAMASNGIKVTWSTAVNATGYTVYSSSYNTKTKKWSGWSNRGTTTKTSWTDTKVKSGTQYRYTVRAKYNTYAGAYNKNGTKLLFLAQPTVKIANNASGVKVSWNKIAGSAGYTIYRAEYANGKWSSWKNMGTIKNGSTVSWVDKSAVSGTQYRYTVRAVNGSTMSTYKASNSVIYLAQPKVSFANAAGGMKVSWGAVPGATGYKVYSSTYNASTKKWSSWTARGTVTATSWTDTSAKSGTYYKYTVKAINGSYTSTFISTSGLIRLAQPTVKVAADANGVKVTWNKIAGAKNYVVYRSELQNGVWSGWSNKGTLANTVFAWVDKSTVKGATYRYTVRAINNKAGSSYAASNSVVPTVTTAATITSSNAKTQFTPILAQYYSLTEGRHDAYLADYTNYKSLLSESWYQQNDPYRGTSHLYKFKTVKSETELRNSYKKYISASLVDNMPMGTLVSLNGNFYLAYNNAVGMGTYDVNSIKFVGEANGGYLVSADYYNSGGVYCQTDVFLVKTVNGKLILDSFYDTVYDHDYDYVSPSYSSILDYYK